MIRLDLRARFGTVDKQSLLWYSLPSVCRSCIPLGCLRGCKDKLCGRRKRTKRRNAIPISTTPTLSELCM